MSGGHWDYRQYQLRELLEDIGNDGAVVQRLPKLAQIFRGFGRLFDNTIHMLDWDLSGDTSINNNVGDEEFEKIFIDEIGKIVKKQYVLKVFDVKEGKFASESNERQK